MFDKQKLEEMKRGLTLEQVEEFLSIYGGDPINKSDHIVSRTIDHNPPHEGSMKLYYYPNNGEGGLFRSYTGDDETFDIFELLIKIYKIQFGKEIDLYNAVFKLCGILNLPIPEENENLSQLLENPDFKLLKKYDKIKAVEYKENKLEYKIYDDNILKNLPKPRLEIWEKEGISAEIISRAEICYDPINCGIVIPFRNDKGELIGIRERTLIKENEEQYGKYRPAYIGGQMYNHSLGLSLYGLNAAKNNISITKTAIIFESEKSVLKYRSYFSDENNIAVAICGSSLTLPQVQLLKKYKVDNLIIALDRQYKQINDEEHKQWVKKLQKITQNYSKYFRIDFLFDTENLLDYKDSPIDKGKEIFIELYNNKLNMKGYRYR